MATINHTSSLQNCWIPYPYYPTPTVPYYPTYPTYPTMPAKTGWICPKCGKGVNPNMTTCPCDANYTVTWETTNGPVTYGDSSE